VGVSGGREGLGLVAETRLYQNSPNPFSRETIIRYQISKPGKVSLKIYNITGQLVRVLVQSAQEAGIYSLKWDKTDNQNKQVGAGVYVYQLIAGDRTQNRKMTLLK
jgi:flagellar hook assembly protein FlgD